MHKIQTFPIPGSKTAITLQFKNLRVMISIYEKVMSSIYYME